MSSDGFANEAVGGTTLVRPAIQSPNFVTGSTGWSINQNGTAEFNSLVVRNGTIISGLFLLYNSSVPALGGLVAAFAPQAGGTDTVGNVYPQGFSFGVWNASGALKQHLGIDTMGNLSIADTSGTTRIFTQPFQNQPLNLTTALSGIFTAAMQLSSSDANEVTQGELAAVQIGTGASAKMCTVLMSPFGTTTGSALLLQAENDGSTDTAVATLCTVTSQGGTLTFAPIAAFIPGGFILYSGGGTVTVVTQTSGSGTIPIPVGVTSALAEAWGAGGTGAFSGNFLGAGQQAEGGGGGGGGEYAAEPALVVPSGGTVSYVVGVGGNHLGSPGGSPNANGTASTLTGSSVTVTANGGLGRGSIVSTVAGGAGTGSTNTVHHNGAAGANGGIGPNGSSAAGGGGGGSSAGPSAAGAAGSAGGTSSGTAAGGSGGTAPSGGGAGGAGGSGTDGGSPVGNAGIAGTAPGGGSGGGGAGENLSTGASHGSVDAAGGQVRLTYTSGAPGILFSVAAASGTDQFGTSYPAGTQLIGNLPTTLGGALNVAGAETLTGIATPSTPAAGKGVLYATTNGTLAEVLPSGWQGDLVSGPAADFTHFVVVSNTGFVQASKAWSIPANDAQVGTTYRLTMAGNGTLGVTARQIEFQTSGGFARLIATVGVNSASITFKVVCEITVISLGSPGTCNVSLQLSAADVTNNTMTAGAGFSQAAAFTSTSAFTFQINGQWGNTGQTFTSFQSYLERLGP